MDYFTDKINEYNFVNHAHNDAGAFQIYYKGPLAIDAGIYQGSSGGNQGYNSPHNKNFFKRTIAHNSLLIYDPNEIFPSFNYGGANKSKFVANDGGQRLPGVEWHQASDLNDMLTGNFKTGKVLANGFGPNAQTPDYSYLKGDITDAYSSKVKEVKRSFVFLNFKDAKIELTTLSNYNLLLKLAYDSGEISDSQLESLNNWRKSPETWGK